MKESNFQPAFNIQLEKESTSDFTLRHCAMDARNVFFVRYIEGDLVFS